MWLALRNFMTENAWKKSIEEPPHLSGKAIVTGQAKFIGDAIKPEGMLAVACVPSMYAHAKILNIDLSLAQKFPGVVAVLSSKDIPGENQIGHTIKDEPLLPEAEVMYIGQPVVLVVANDAKVAKAAAKLVVISYEELTPLLTIDEAVKVKSFYVPPATMQRGDLEAGFKAADFVITDEVNTPTQEHLYFETQRVWAIPEDDNNITLYSSTQATAEIQEIAARVLGIASKDVTVDVKRLGGAFGGKERGATLWACLAAFAAFSTKKPVEIKLDRLADVKCTGKRHPFNAKYKVGFSKAGKILAYDVVLSSNGGAFVDLSLPVLQRAMFHADNAYFIPNVKIVGQACKTNLPPNTAFRGFGAPQGIFTIEAVMEKIAEKLQLDPLKVRELNFYRDGETTPYGQQVFDACSSELWQKLQLKTDYQKLIQATAEFNQKNKYVKRGIGVVPVKFGISFTFTTLNQGTALIWVYTDGSISMSHGGIEMGQEVNTKVAQVVARELGVSLSRIRMVSSNTERNGNASPTAASTGSDINGNAALLAARKIKRRLSKVAVILLKERLAVKTAATTTQQTPDTLHLIFAADHVFDQRFPEMKIEFAELAEAAYQRRVNLGAQGFYKTPRIFYDSAKMQGTPFYYYVFGVALVHAEVDLLTGAHKLLQVNVVHECGKLLNREADLGQITGAFLQGYGYCMMEDMPFDNSGKYLAASLATYKIPTMVDLPEKFEIELVEREDQHASVFGSKAVGEPPLIYGFGAYFAILHALKSLNSEKPVELSIPATPEAVLKAILNFKF